MGLREEKKETQRREIMDAAIALFRERGYDQTRVQDIIERLRISEGTFFNYFPSKDEILHEFAVEQNDAFAALLKSELVAVRSAVERVREVMRAIAAAWSSDREFMTVVLTRSSLFRATGTFREKELESYRLFAGLFRDGQARGEFRRDADPIQLAEILIGILFLTAENWLIGWWGKQTEDFEPRLLRAVDIFLDGCRVEGASVKSAAKPTASSPHRSAHRRRKG